MQSLEELLTECRRYNYGVNISFHPTGLRDSRATVAVAFFSVNQRKPSKLRSYDCQTGHDILEVASRAWAGLDEPFETYSGTRVQQPKPDLTDLLKDLDL